jgi:hypothetical protein
VFAQQSSTLTCKGYDKVAHQIDGEHFIRCKFIPIANCEYCFKHGCQHLADLGASIAKKRADLLILEREQSELECALENR